MCYWILPASRVPIARTTIQVLTDDEVATVEVQQTVKAYDESIQAKIGNSVFEKDLPEPSQCKMHSQDEEEDDGGKTFEPFAPSHAMPEADEFDVKLMMCICRLKYYFLKVTILLLAQLLAEREIMMATLLGREILILFWTQGYMKSNFQMDMSWIMQLMSLLNLFIHRLMMKGISFSFCKKSLIIRRMT